MYVLLGELCGLLPNCQPTSQQLHFVVELSSGIRDKMVSSSSSPAIVASAQAQCFNFEIYDAHTTNIFYVYNQIMYIRNGQPHLRISS